MARHTEEKINFRGVGELRDQDMDVERFEDGTYEIVCSADYASAGTFDLSEADTARLVEFLQGGRSRPEACCVPRCCTRADRGFGCSFCANLQVPPYRSHDNE
jgi:hypothetical protein